MRKKGKKNKETGHHIFKQIINSNVQCLSSYQLCPTPSHNIPSSVHWEVARYRLQRRFYAGQMGGWVILHWGSPAPAAHPLSSETATNIDWTEGLFADKTGEKVESSEAEDMSGCYPSVGA